MARAMRIQSVRFGEFQWNTIQHAAALEGVSASQYIRDAATVRAILALATRGQIPADFYERMVTALPEFADILESSKVWTDPAPDPLDQ